MRPADLIQQLINLPADAILCVEDEMGNTGEQYASPIDGVLEVHPGQWHLVGKGNYAWHRKYGSQVNEWPKQERPEDLPERRPPASP